MNVKAHEATRKQRKIKYMRQSLSMSRLEYNYWRESSVNEVYSRLKSLCICIVLKTLTWFATVDNYCHQCVRRRRKRKNSERIYKHNLNQTMPQSSLIIKLIHSSVSFNMSTMRKSSQVSVKIPRAYINTHLYSKFSPNNNYFPLLSNPPNQDWIYKFCYYYYYFFFLIKIDVNFVTERLMKECPSCITKKNLKKKKKPQDVFLISINQICLVLLIFLPFICLYIYQ